MPLSDDALRRYRKDQFTDDDVARCCGLSVRAWRELIKTRAVRTYGERGRGRVRTCDNIVLKRAAVIAALNQAGLGLVVAGQIAYFLPYHALLYEICNPITVLCEGSAELDPTTELPRRVGRPKTDWFTSDQPAHVEPESDWLIEIYDSRFVAAIYGIKADPIFFGDLRDDNKRFVSWWPLHRRPQFDRVTETVVHALSRPRLLDFIEDWENPLRWRKQLDLLDYKFERHDKDRDSLQLIANEAARSPIVKTTINVSLAIRKALRRYLGLEPQLLRLPTV